jgi:hypothetical protein
MPFFAFLILSAITVAAVHIAKVSLQDEDPEKRSSDHSKHQLMMSEEFELNGSDWFGRKVHLEMDATIDVIKHLGSRSYPVDMVIRELNGEPLIVLQMKSPPHPSSPGKDLSLRDEMAEAGIAIAYLGEDPAPGALQMMIESMIQAKAIHKTAKA